MGEDWKVGEKKGGKKQGQEARNPGRKPRVIPYFISTHRSYSEHKRGLEAGCCEWLRSKKQIVSLGLSPLPSASLGDSYAIQNNILALCSLLPPAQSIARYSDTSISSHLESAFPRFNRHWDSRKLYEGAGKKVRIVYGESVTLTL